MKLVFALLVTMAHAAGPVAVPVPTVPTGAVAISASGSGSGPVSVALPSTPGRTTYVCAVEAAPTALGARISQASVSGVAAPLTFAPTTNGVARHNFTPCQSASAPNTPVVFTVTASGEIEANAWGYQQ